MQKLFFIVCVFFCASKINSQSLFDKLNNNAEGLKNNSILASVGNTKITAEEFFYNYEYGPAFTKRSKDSKKLHLQYMINERLLSAYGKELQLDSTKQVREMHDSITDDLATEAMFKEDILSKIEINEEELDTVVSQKNIELEIKWLFGKDLPAVNNFLDKLNQGVPFDVLFETQISDSVYLDERMMKVTRYSLGKNNPALASIADTLKAGSYSIPIHVEDGWYIIKLNNVFTNLITNQTEQQKLEYEAKQALTKGKMDILSDEFVNNLFKENNPTIKRKAFNLLRSYLGKFKLEKEFYNIWALEEKLNEAIKNLGVTKQTITDVKLVELKDKSITLSKFLIWYRAREAYIKFNKKDINSFSQSVEQLVWRMVRDNLLSNLAFERGFYEDDWVKQQSKWWENKILYSAVRNHLSNEILLENKEINLNSDNSKTEIEYINKELSRKIFLKIREMKNKLNVKIYDDILDKVNVSDLENKKSINTYAVKKGGLIPRPPYPTIDYDWAAWE